jgi:hypothetical protein
MAILKYRLGHFMFDVSVIVTTVIGDAKLSSLVGRYKRPASLFRVEEQATWKKM